MTIKTRVFTERRSIHDMRSNMFHGRKYIISISKIPNSWHEPSSNRMGGESEDYEIMVIDDENLNYKLFEQFKEAFAKSYLDKWHDIRISFHEKDVMKKFIRKSKWDPVNKIWSVFIDQTNYIYFDFNPPYGDGPLFLGKKYEDYYKPIEF